MAQEMRADAREMRNVLEEQEDRINHIDRQQDLMIRQANRNMGRIEKYLNQTSNCNLYIVLGV